MSSSKLLVDHRFLLLCESDPSKNFEPRLFQGCLTASEEFSFCSFSVVLPAAVWTLPLPFFSCPFSPPLRSSTHCQTHLGMGFCCFYPEYARSLNLWPQEHHQHLPCMLLNENLHLSSKIEADWYLLSANHDPDDILRFPSSSSSMISPARHFLSIQPWQRAWMWDPFCFAPAMK